MMKLNSLKRSLDLIIFILTIFLVLYGLLKGFNVLELMVNLVYFSALIAKMIVDFIDVQSKEGENE